MTWLDIILLASGLVTAMATSIMAYQGYQQRGVDSRRAAAELPLAEVSVSGDQHNGVKAIHIIVSPQDRVRWRVKSVSAWPKWQALIAEAIEGPPNALNETVYRPSKWRRSVTFDHPRVADFIYLRSSWSGPLMLSVTLCLAASYKVTSRFTVRRNIQP